jgi:Ino eighty subunit 2
MRTRSKRQTRAAASASASVSVSRSPLNSGEPSKSLRLTVKMPSNKLREATGSGRAAGRRSVNVFREDPILSGPRSSRNRKKIVEVATSDEEEIDDQEEDEVDDEDAAIDDDEDADADADGDIDMDDTPPQPAIRRGKVAPPRVKPPKSVEAKEMEMDEDEDEEEEEEEEPISDTDEDAEGEVDDQDESALPDVIVDDLDDLDEEDELDDDLDSDALAMQSGKTTKRQRGNLGNDFLQLPMGEELLVVKNRRKLELTNKQSLKSRSI